MNGHILEATFYGHWDAYVFQSFISNVKVSLIRLRGQEWASMTDLRQWHGGNHEFRFSAKAELNRLVAAGSSHAAYIVQDNSPYLELINDVAPTLSGYKRRLFTNKADAIKWLDESGFKLSLLSKEYDEQEK